MTKRPTVVAMTTRLETSRILERIAGLIPERTALVGLTGPTNLVAGDIQADGFTLELARGDETVRVVRVVGTIRDSGAERLVRLRVVPTPLQWWPPAVIGVAISGLVYWRFGVGSPLAVALVWLLGVAWSRFAQPTLAPTDELCLRIKSALDADVA